jgi:hypothetical protein
MIFTSPNRSPDASGDAHRLSAVVGFSSEDCLSMLTQPT